MCTLAHGQESPNKLYFCITALTGYVLIIFFYFHANGVQCNMCHNTVTCKKCRKQQEPEKSICGIVFFMFYQILLYNNLGHNLVHVDKWIHNSFINHQKFHLESIQEHTENVKVSYKA